MYLHMLPKPPTYMHTHKDTQCTDPAQQWINVFF